MLEGPDQKANPFVITHESGLAPGDPLVRAVPHGFTTDEFAQLRALLDEQSFEGRIAQGEEADDELAPHRRSQIRMLKPIDYEWVCAKLWPSVLKLNEKYRFDILAIGELQLAYYDENNAGFYNWHMDVDAGRLSRKITLSILLNDPADYDGGDVQFNTGGNTEEVTQTAIRSQTHMVAFPPFVLHRVTPVTRGRRYVMIAWIHGNDWR
jgi:PKHD-type hydroxylase